MVPPTADEARRVVDLYYRTHFPDLHVGEAVPDSPDVPGQAPNNTGWVVTYTSGSSTYAVRVVGYAATDLLPMP